ncbi:MAG: aspartate aminotransferase family protein [Bacteroidia bacterium]|nr:MAG: aspartate aminotransferase family protein [Bacteroidia bacterium]PIE86429.1 MAG: aspartate aminotransferase family protein [Bacteroidia bacterium]
MASIRSLFLQHMAQTSDFPLLLEFEKAKGVYLFSPDGKKYLDFISGISVSNLGHGNKRIIEKTQKQIAKHMHLMVYGEYVQSPQVELAVKLNEVLPKKLNASFFVNSGSEANEAALKLAKRYTGRNEIIAFKNAYHGSSHGAMSLASDEDFTSSVRPLLPGVRHLDYNNEEQLEYITEKTACVVAEVIQAEAGIRPARASFLQKLHKKCKQTGALLIFDEVQTAMGRTGKMFAFEHYQVIPDILTLAKAFGGGMPLGAMISDKKISDSFKTKPVLGHITTFGGHPVCCAAALENLSILKKSKLIAEALEKEKRIREKLTNPKIKEIRGKGLFLSIQLDSFEHVQDVIQKCIQNGLIVDWFLFENKSIRIAPPLIISNEEIDLACEILNAVI